MSGGALYYAYHREVLYIMWRPSQACAFPTTTSIPESPESLAFNTLPIGALIATLVERRLGRQQSPV
jgi:hypothetical protein